MDTGQVATARRGRDDKGVGAASFHSRPRTSLSVNQRLGSVHDLLVSDGETRIVQGFAHLVTEPFVMGFGIRSEPGRQATLCHNAGQEDPTGELSTSCPEYEFLRNLGQKTLPYALLRAHVSRNLVLGSALIPSP